MIIKQEELKPYIDADADLIPIHVWNKQTIGKNGKVVIRGKTPLITRWTKTPKDTKGAVKLTRKGYNIGYRIGETDLVIDVDERNYKDGVNSLDLLCEFLGVSDLSEVAPTVVTGSGGYHYYFKIPSGLNIKETVDRFPGIEFKTQGRQVVCAGSKHPNGKYYQWDDFSPLLKDRPQLSVKLLKELKYVPPENRKDAAGDLTGEQLTKLLNQIPIDDFNTNDKWFAIMCAAHHGTNGAGIDEFLEWSLADEEFADDEHLIRCRWASLGERDLTITINTLYKEVRRYGGEPNVATAEEDFKDFLEDDENNDELSIEDALEEIKDEQEHTSLEAVNQTDEETIAIANRLGGRLSPKSTDEDKVQAIRSALHIKAKVSQLSILEKIMVKLGMKVGAFNKLVKAVKDDMDASIEQDLCRVLAELTYKVKFNKGHGLIYSIGEQFWSYNGKYWNVITKKYLEKMVGEVLDKMRKKVNITRNENSIVTEAANILARLSAVNNDKLGLSGKPRPVINCLNGELWINSNGTVKLKKHNPRSCLLQVLDVEYDPSAECDIFEQMLDSTFSKFDDSWEIIDFIYEMMGYIIQPDKDLEKWFLFYGTGGDGKSTLIRIISALLGSAVLPESINTFTKDNHILSDVPGKLLIVDDDMDKNTRLPDGMLKKLCGRNDLNGNPKGAKTERFTPATTLILSTNGWPRTNDLSEGGRRRPIVIPFDRNFHNEGAILDIDKQIIKKELSGVLNIALAGLLRLRKRGFFTEPKSCMLAKKKWIDNSNMNAMFLEEYVEVTKLPDDTMSLKELYDLYKEWCIDNDITRHTGKQHFRQYMEDLGLPFGALGGNVMGFRGVISKLGNKFIDDFDDSILEKREINSDEENDSDEDW